MGGGFEEEQALALAILFKINSLHKKLGDPATSWVLVCASLPAPSSPT